MRRASASRVCRSSARKSGAMRCSTTWRRSATSTTTCQRRLRITTTHPAPPRRRRSRRTTPCRTALWTLFSTHARSGFGGPVVRAREQISDAGNPDDDIAIDRALNNLVSAVAYPPITQPHRPHVDEVQRDFQVVDRADVRRRRLRSPGLSWPKEKLCYNRPAPRACGDEASSQFEENAATWCSPRMRG